MDTIIFYGKLNESINSNDYTTFTNFISKVTSGNILESCFFWNFFILIKITTKKKHAIKIHLLYDTIIYKENCERINEMLKMILL